MDHMVDTDITPEEWQRASEFTKKPVCFNFLILLKAPGDMSAFLDANGNAVVTYYSLVDWKWLANKLQERLSGHMPKSIKVYVADDGPDVLDIINKRLGESAETEIGSDFATRTDSAIQQVGMSGYRAGILRISKASGLHLYPANGVYRSPLSGLVFGIKFLKTIQAMDYLPTALERLTGSAYGLPMSPMSLISDLDAPLTLIPEIHAWLEEQFGTAYSTESCLIFLSMTQSKT